MNEERKAHQKELYRLLSLDPKDHLDEGETIVKAKVKSNNTENTCDLSFPAQFTKIREDRSVNLYVDRKKVSSAEVIAINYEKRTLTITGQHFDSEEFLIIQSTDIAPFAIINSLKKLQEIGGNEIYDNLINRKSNINHYGEPTLKNINKTVDEMEEGSNLIIMGPPGTGKTVTATGIVNHLLEDGKSVLITSNSHHAINNLCNAVDSEHLIGAKICSRREHYSENENINNIYVNGKEIDGYVEQYNLVAGTAFALSRIQELRFDYLIVDEASQMKMSYLVSLLRICDKVIVLGDPNQLQSISILEETKGGESILNYLLQGKKMVPDSMGYFLNKTYRMQGKVASVISDVFYEGKLGWAKEDEEKGIQLIVSDHKTGQSLSPEEANEVVKLVKKLKKRGIEPNEIMVVAPYNAQVKLIRSKIKGVRCNTVDSFQGQQARIVIYSSTNCGSKAKAAEFATNSNRINVALSRSTSEVYIIASKALINSKNTSPEFRKIIKMIS